MSKKVFAVVLAVILLTMVDVGQAQLIGKTPRVGFLWPQGPEDIVRQAMTTALLQGLRELGYVEAKNIAFEYRFGEGQLARFPELAADLVGNKVDIIVAGGIAATRAAKNATKTIPIVMIGVGADPVEAGLVESLAHPGGNVTGFTNLSWGIAGKRLELLKEAAPKISRVAFLSTPAADQSVLLIVKEVQTAARALGLNAQSWDINSTDSFESVFAALKKDRPHGLLVGGGPVLNSNTKLIVDFALASRLPSMYFSLGATEMGGLMSYGPDPLDQFRRAAVYVDKILKGTKAADLPVQRPITFEFVVNLKTANQIGLTVPPNVLVRATKVFK